MPSAFLSADLSVMLLPLPSNTGQDGGKVHLPATATRSLSNDGSDNVDNGVLGDNYDDDATIEGATVYVNHHIDISYHKGDATVDASPSSFGWCVSDPAVLRVGTQDGGYLRKTLTSHSTTTEHRANSRRGPTS